MFIYYFLDVDFFNANTKLYHVKRQCAKNIAVTVKSKIRCNCNWRKMYAGNFSRGRQNRMLHRGHGDVQNKKKKISSKILI